MTNRLKSATSPYLLQHAGNPVDWWPWCEEAFAESRRRDVPVLLSVGYAACHWCHVMAHESFEDPDTAALVNDKLVAIKVDREERPDIDAVYMAATQAMTGQGGWPMTVFMTPGGEPFFCGTYFPRARFRQLVTAVAEAWRQNKEKVTSESERISLALAENASAMSGLGGEAGDLDLADVTATAVNGLARSFDKADGGFGGSPKFPPSMVLEFLLRHHERTGSDAALSMATETCAAMARGGMYDQLGGGFARYSVDSTWTVPHFEKMLYDNALLIRAYTHLWRSTGSSLARRVAEESCDFLLRELRTPEGGFAASLDADSDGAEGAFYVWTPAQLREVLGDEDAAFAADAFHVTAAGTFEHGASVLQRLADPAAPGTTPPPAAGPVSGSGAGGGGTASHLAGESPGERFDRIRGILLAARESRTRPARDDKVVAAWNGMAIGALAEAGMLFNRPDLVAAACDAAELLLAAHFSQETGPLAAGSVSGQPSSGTRTGHPGAGDLETGDLRAGDLRAGDSGAGDQGVGERGARLVRTSRDGVAGPSAGLLEDYACVAAGLLTLAGMTGDNSWVPIAGALLDTVLAAFGDGSGGFYDTPRDGERLIFRPADPTDNATPSGQFAAADALLSYGALTGEARYREAATAALRVLPPIAARYPRAAGAGLAVAEALLSGPDEIAIVGPDDDPRTGDLLRTALHLAPPGAVFARGPGEPAPAPAHRRAPGTETTPTRSDASSGTGAASSGAGPVPAGSGATPSGAGPVPAGSGATPSGTGAVPSGTGAVSASAEAVPLLAGRTLVDGAPAAYVCQNFACRLPVTDVSALREVLRSHSG